MKLTAVARGRLIGVCALCSLTIAAFRLKLACWELGVFQQSATGRSIASLTIGTLALTAMIGSWRGKRWGYVLVFVVAGIENVSAVLLHLSLPVGEGAKAFVSLAFMALPLFATMIAAGLLMLSPTSAEADTL